MVKISLKTMKDTIEVTSVVDGDPFRLEFKEPEHSFERGSLNIRLMDTSEEQRKDYLMKKRLLLKNLQE